jgi:hypothetical protein
VTSDHRGSDETRLDYIFSDVPSIDAKLPNGAMWRANEDMARKLIAEKAGKGDADLINKIETDIDNYRRINLATDHSGILGSFLIV